MISSYGPRKGTAWAEKAAAAKRVAIIEAKQRRCEAMRERLLDALEAAPGPLSLSDCCIALGFTGDRGFLADRLAELETSGLVKIKQESRTHTNSLGQSSVIGTAVRVWHRTKRKR